MLKDMFFSALVVIVVVAIAALAGPKGPARRPIPRSAARIRGPIGRFLWLFGLLSLSPPAAETFIILTLPVILVLALLAVPFISNRGERAPSRRPMAVLLVIVIYSILGVLTYLGQTSPWSPEMTAWSGDAVPAIDHQIERPRTVADGIARGGRVSEQAMPQLSRAGRHRRHARARFVRTSACRLTHDQLIDQVSNGTPGGGNMPAYGKQMKPAEMTALVDFLVSLRPANTPPARIPLK